MYPAGTCGQVTIDPSWQSGPDGNIGLDLFEYFAITDIVEIDQLIMEDNDYMLFWRTVDPRLRVDTLQIIGGTELSAVYFGITQNLHLENLANLSVISLPMLSGGAAQDMQSVHLENLPKLIVIDMSGVETLESFTWQVSFK